jgi:hypothetical protein
VLFIYDLIVDNYDTIASMNEGTSTPRIELSIANEQRLQMVFDRSGELANNYNYEMSDNLYELVVISLILRATDVVDSALELNLSDYDDLFEAVTGESMDDVDFDRPTNGSKFAAELVGAVDSFFS